MSVPLNPTPINICRLCTHYIEAKASGKECCGVFGCGGPAAGKAFPMYEGILTPIMIEELCYVCGNNSDKYLTVNSVKLGICLKCIPFIEHIIMGND